MSEEVFTPLAVRVHGLTYRYADQREALRGINLEVKQGESVALVGPNGAGKSTFLLHLNGILPERGRSITDHHHGLDLMRKSAHTTAAIQVDGIEVSPANFREVRRRVGLLFQDPDDQLFAPTVLEDVAFGPLNMGMSKAEARRVALDALARVDMLDAADRLPHHLSFGERKRACLAGLLACSPSILALDEPTANLDPRGRRGFIALMKSLPGTKLIATHDLEMVLELCPRTIVLDRGIVVAQGESREVLANEELMEKHGLEVPMSLRNKKRLTTETQRHREE